MLNKLQTLILVLFILASALIWAVKPAQAMGRESLIPIQGEIVEGRAIFITRYDKRCNSWVEVLEV